MTNVNIIVMGRRMEIIIDTKRVINVESSFVTE
ncbi:Uncharacterised protein [Dorea longicatena]|uniref:Uncharacterized protein n=1 Tax=Dorea longicatena TaxID=88431 RepID=A0A564UVY4_9FIRM|nr:Uncharacterised protein [Dorea longicatena]